jgi:hypothetical protein
MSETTQIPDAAQLRALHETPSTDSAGLGLDPITSGSHVVETVTHSNLHPVGTAPASPAAQPSES